MGIIWKQMWTQHHNERSNSWKCLKLNRTIAQRNSIRVAWSIIKETKFFPKKIFYELFHCVYVDSMQFPVYFPDQSISNIIFEHLELYLRAGKHFSTLFFHFIYISLTDMCHEF